MSLLERIWKQNYKRSTRKRCPNRCPKTGIDSSDIKRQSPGIERQDITKVKEILESYRTNF